MFVKNVKTFSLDRSHLCCEPHMWCSRMSVEMTTQFKEIDICFIHFPQKCIAFRIVLVYKLYSCMWQEWISLVYLCPYGVYIDIVTALVGLSMRLSVCLDTCVFISTSASGWISLKLSQVNDLKWNFDAITFCKIMAFCLFYGDWILIPKLLCLNPLFSLWMGIAFTLTV